MKLLLAFLLWCLLWVVCWPLAILAVLAFPVVWLLLLPFRLVAAVLGACLALIQSILYLPARLLGYRNGC